MTCLSNPFRSYSTSYTGLSPLHTFPVPFPCIQTLQLVSKHLHTSRCVSKFQLFFITSTCNMFGHTLQPFHPFPNTRTFGPVPNTLQPFPSPTTRSNVSQLLSTFFEPYNIRALQHILTCFQALLTILEGVSCSPNHSQLFSCPTTFF